MTFLDDMNPAEMFAQADAAMVKKLADMHTFDLSRYERFKIVLSLFGKEYVGEEMDRETTEWQLKNLHEAAQLTPDPFWSTEPDVVAVDHLLGEYTHEDVPGRTFWRKIQSKRDLDIRASFTCVDCGADVWTEHYTVNDEVFQQATGLDPRVPHDERYCVGDMERRLGRKLTPADFVDAPVNDPEVGDKSPRLLNRLGFQD